MASPIEDSIRKLNISSIDSNNFKQNNFNNIATQLNNVSGSVDNDQQQLVEIITKVCEYIGSLHDNQIQGINPDYKRDISGAINQLYFQDHLQDNNTFQLGQLSSALSSIFNSLEQQGSPANSKVDIQGVISSIQQLMQSNSESNVRRQDWEYAKLGLQSLSDQFKIANQLAQNVTANSKTTQNIYTALLGQNIFSKEFEQLHQDINTFNQEYLSENAQLRKLLLQDYTQSNWSEVSGPFALLEQMSNDVSNYSVKIANLTQTFQNLPTNAAVNYIQDVLKMSENVNVFVIKYIENIKNNVHLTDDEKNERISHLNRIMETNDTNTRQLSNEIANIVTKRLSAIEQSVDQGQSTLLSQIANGRNIGRNIANNLNNMGYNSARLRQDISTDQYTTKSSYNPLNLLSTSRKDNLRKMKTEADRISQIQFEYSQGSNELSRISDDLNSAQSNGDVQLIETLKRKMESKSKELDALMIALNKSGAILGKAWNDMSRSDKERMEHQGAKVHREVESILASIQAANRNKLALNAAYNFKNDQNEISSLTDVNDALKELREEAEKTGDKSQESSVSISGFFSSLSNGFSGILGFISNALNKVGLGAYALGPISLLAEANNFHIQQGRQRYQSMGQAALLGVNDLGSEAARAQSRMMYGNQLYMMSGGRIDQMAVQESYKSLVQVGGQVGVSPEQTARDMDYFNKQTALMQQVYGVDQSTINDVFKTYYQDMRMSADQTANAFYRLTQTAQAANVPIDQYLKAVSGVADQYMKVGIAGYKAESVLDNLMKQHIRIDIAKEVATQLGNAVGKFADNEDAVAFAATVNGDDPFVGLAKAARSHDENGNPRDEFVDDMTTYMDTYLSYKMIPYGNDPDMYRWGLTKELKQEYGFDQRTASMIASAKEKYGADSVTFKEMFKDALNKSDNPNATLEDGNQKILGQLQTMAGQLAESDKLEALSKGKLFAAATQVGGAIDDFINAIAPALFAIQDLMINLAVKGVDLLSKLIDSDIFEQAKNKLLKALGWLPVALTGFFGFLIGKWLLGKIFGILGIAWKGGKGILAAIKKYGPKVLSGAKGLFKHPLTYAGIYLASQLIDVLPGFSTAEAADGKSPEESWLSKTMKTFTEDTSGWERKPAYDINNPDNHPVMSNNDKLFKDIEKVVSGDLSGLTDPKAVDEMIGKIDAYKKDLWKDEKRPELLEQLDNVTKELKDMRSAMQAERYNAGQDPQTQKIIEQTLGQSIDGTNPEAAALTEQAFEYTDDMITSGLDSFMSMAGIKKSTTQTKSADQSSKTNKPYGSDAGIGYRDAAAIMKQTNPDIYDQYQAITGESGFIDSPPQSYSSEWSARAHDVTRNIVEQTRSNRQSDRIDSNTSIGYTEQLSSDITGETPRQDTSDISNIQINPEQFATSELQRMTATKTNQTIIEGELDQSNELPILARITGMRSQQLRRELNDLYEQRDQVQAELRRQEEYRSKLEQRYRKLADTLNKDDLAENVRTEALEELQTVQSRIEDADYKESGLIEKAANNFAEIQDKRVEMSDAIKDEVSRHSEETNKAVDGESESVRSHAENADSETADKADTITNDGSKRTSEAQKTAGDVTSEFHDENSEQAKSVLDVIKEVLGQIAEATPTEEDKKKEGQQNNGEQGQREGNKQPVTELSTKDQQKIKKFQNDFAKRRSEMRSFSGTGYEIGLNYNRAYQQAIGDNPDVQKVFENNKEQQDRVNEEKKQRLIAESYEILNNPSKYNNYSPTVPDNVTNISKSSSTTAEMIANGEFTANQIKEAEQKKIQNAQKQSAEAIASGAGNYVPQVTDNHGSIATYEKITPELLAAQDADRIVRNENKQKQQEKALQEAKDALKLKTMDLLPKRDQQTKSIVTYKTTQQLIDESEKNAEIAQAEAQRLEELKNQRMQEAREILNNPSKYNNYALAVTDNHGSIATYKSMDQIMEEADEKIQQLSLEKEKKQEEIDKNKKNFEENFDHEKREKWFEDVQKGIYGGAPTMFAFKNQKTVGQYLDELKQYWGDKFKAVGSWILGEDSEEDKAEKEKRAKEEAERHRKEINAFNEKNAIIDQRDRELNRLAIGEAFQSLFGDNSDSISATMGNADWSSDIDLEETDSKSSAPLSREAMGAKISGEVNTEQRNEHRLSDVRNKLIELFMDTHAKVMDKFRTSVTKEHGYIWDQLSVEQDILADTADTAANGYAAMMLAIGSGGSGGGISTTGDSSGDIAVSGATALKGKLTVYHPGENDEEGGFGAAYDDHPERGKFFQRLSKGAVGYYVAVSENSHIKPGQVVRFKDNNGQWHFALAVDTGGKLEGDQIDVFAGSDLLPNNPKNASLFGGMLSSTDVEVIGDYKGDYDKFHELFQSNKGQWVQSITPVSGSNIQYQPGSGGSGNNSMVNAAVQQALRIAANPNSYYSQNQRLSANGYDCSSLVYRTLKEAGFNVPYIGDTSSMPSELPKLGFKQYKFNPNDLQYGDILWRDGHVAYYIGNNQTVEAMGQDYGVRKGSIFNRKFTHYFRAANNAPSSNVKPMSYTPGSYSSDKSTTPPSKVAGAYHKMPDWNNLSQEEVEEWIRKGVLVPQVNADEWQKKYDYLYEAYTPQFLKNINQGQASLLGYQYTSIEDWKKDYENNDQHWISKLVRTSNKNLLDNYEQQIRILTNQLMGIGPNNPNDVLTLDVLQQLLDKYGKSFRLINNNTENVELIYGHPFTTTTAEYALQQLLKKDNLNELINKGKLDLNMLNDLDIDQAESLLNRDTGLKDEIIESLGIGTDQQAEINQKTLNNIIINGKSFSLNQDAYWRTQENNGGLTNTLYRTQDNSSAKVIRTATGGQPVSSWTGFKSGDYGSWYLCGPTAMATALAASGIETDPTKVKEAMGGAQMGPGIVQGILSKFGMESTFYDHAGVDKEEEIKQALQNGQAVIFGWGPEAGHKKKDGSVNDPYGYGAGGDSPGHYTTAFGINEKGQLYMSDPGRGDEGHYQLSGRTLNDYLRMYKPDVWIMKKKMVSNPAVPSSSASSNGPVSSPSGGGYNSQPFSASAMQEIARMIRGDTYGIGGAGYRQRADVSRFSMESFNSSGKYDKEVNNTANKQLESISSGKPVSETKKEDEKLTEEEKKKKQEQEEAARKKEQEHIETNHRNNLSAYGVMYRDEDIQKMKEAHPEYTDEQVKTELDKNIKYKDDNALLKAYGITPDNKQYANITERVKKTIASNIRNDRGPNGRILDQSKLQKYTEEFKAKGSEHPEEEARAKMFAEDEYKFDPNDIKRVAEISYQTDEKGNITGGNTILRTGDVTEIFPDETDPVKLKLVESQDFIDKRYPSNAKVPIKQLQQQNIPLTQKDMQEENLKKLKAITQKSITDNLNKDEKKKLEKRPDSDNFKKDSKVDAADVVNKYGKQAKRFKLNIPYRLNEDDMAKLTLALKAAIADGVISEKEKQYLYDLTFSLTKNQQTAEDIVNQLSQQKKEEQNTSK